MSPPRVEVGLDLDGHGGAHRRPGELVLARPLHAHGTPAGRARQQHRVERHVVGAVVAVAAGALDVLHDDALRRQRTGEARGRRADCRRPGSATTTCTLVAPVHCAIAQEGAIEACAMKGRVYCRRIVRATCAGRRRLALVDGAGLGGLALEPRRRGCVSSGSASPALHARALAQGRQGPASAAASRLGDDPGKAAVPHHGDDAWQRSRAPASSSDGQLRRPARPASARGRAAGRAS